MSVADFVILIFLLGNILWLIDGLVRPSLLILFALSLVPGIAPNEIFARSFGHPTIAFLFFTFLLSGQLRETGVLRYIVFRFLHISRARRSFLHRSFLYAAAVFVIGSFTAPTVCFLLFYALMEELCAVAGYEKGSAEGRILMGLTACLSSVACAATPIAHTFPLMAMNFYESVSGETLRHASYFRFAFPLALLLALLCFVLLHIMHGRNLKPDDRATQERIDAWLAGSIPTLDRRARLTVAVVLPVLAAWLLPAFIPSLQRLLKPWGQAWPALIGVAVLSYLRTKEGPVMDLGKVLRTHVHFGSLLICATALALGHAMSLPATGVSSLISGHLEPLLGGLSPRLLLMLIAFLTLAMTNVLSNIVTTTLMGQIALPLLLLFSPAHAATGAIIIGFSASLAFALPPSIAHIALAGASGWTDVRTQAKTGGLLALFAAVFISLALRIAV